MLVVEVYTKAGWEITGGNDDAEGRARKSECLPIPCYTSPRQVADVLRCLFESMRTDRGLPLSTERLIELLHEFPPEEPTRKRFIQEMIGWSGRFGPLERGDPELHHAAGSVYAEGMQTHINSDFEGDFITAISRPRTL